MHDFLPVIYIDKKEAVADTMTTLMQQKIPEKQAEAERELMAGSDEKSLKVQWSQCSWHFNIDTNHYDN